MCYFLVHTLAYFINREYGSSITNGTHAAFFGDVASYIPMFHSITGYDKTSYHGNVLLKLIEGLGKDDVPLEVFLKDCMEFVRCYVYCGRPH